MTNTLTLAINSHFPRTMSLLSISQLLPNLSKGTSEPCTTKHGLHHLIHIDPQFFIAAFPGGSNKSRPAGHRRGRPPRLVTEYPLPAWSDQLMEHRPGRPLNTYPFCETNQLQ